MTYLNALPQAGRPVSRPKRGTAPPSVHAVAILFYLCGAFYVIAAALLAVLGSAGAFPAEDFLRPAELAHFKDKDHAAYAIAGAAVLIGLITVVLGRKLQRGRRWVRYLVLLLCVASVALTGYAAVTTRQWTGLTALAAPALYLYLLNTRAARSWFKHKDW